MGLGTVSSKALKWYAIYLRNRHEKTVDQRLKEKGFETYLPMIEEVRQYSDRRKKVLEPMFRGYLFVRTDLKNTSPILQTEGVVRFIGTKTRPSPIPDREISWIRIIELKPIDIKREPSITTGERVRVNSGPLEGLEGIVISVRGGMRVVLLVESIGQALSVQVDPNAIKPIKGEA